MLAGIPFGTPAFVTSWLTDFSSQASSLIKKCQSVADHGFRSQAVVLLRLCIHSKSVHLCRSLFPTGSPNFRDESLPTPGDRLAGDLANFRDPTFPLVGLHREILSATLRCAGTDLSPLGANDLDLGHMVSCQMALPFRFGGAGLRDPATTRAAAFLAAQRSAAQYAAKDGTLWRLHTRLDTTACALRQEVLAFLPKAYHDSIPPVFTSSLSPAGVDDVSTIRPDKGMQSVLQSRVDKTNRETLFTIYKPNTEELIRLKSVAGILTRQFMHSTFVTPSMVDVPGFTFYGHKDLTPLTDEAWCLALCRRFGVPFHRIPSDALHHSGCGLSAGVNGAHAIVCSFSRSQRTWRHNRIRDAFAYAARQFKLQVYTNGRKDVQSSYEFSFKTDEYGGPTSKRSDLVVTDERGISYVLDVTICDPTNSVCVNHKAGGKAGSMPALQLLYI